MKNNVLSKVLLYKYKNDMALKINATHNNTH